MIKWFDKYLIQNVWKPKPKNFRVKLRITKLRDINEQQAWRTEQQEKIVGSMAWFRKFYIEAAKKL
jgi:hypothetical protein